MAKKKVMGDILARAEQKHDNAMKIDSPPYREFKELLHEFAQRKAAGRITRGFNWIAGHGLDLLNRDREERGEAPIPRVSRETVTKYVRQTWPKLYEKCEENDPRLGRSR